MWIIIDDIRINLNHVIEYYIFNSTDDNTFSIRLYYISGQSDRIDFNTEQERNRALDLIDHLIDENYGLHRIVA